MKANRKFRDGEEAVSAVIGVILMVAITVAIAATVYVYVSGMIGTSPQSTPNVQFVKDDINNKLTVASADPGDLIWSDLIITYDATIINCTLYSTTGPEDVTSGTAVVTNELDAVAAGDYIQLGATDVGSIRIRHEDTNTLLGTWTFN